MKEGTKLFTPCPYCKTQGVEHSTNCATKFIHTIRNNSMKYNPKCACSGCQQQRQNVEPYQFEHIEPMVEEKSEISRWGLHTGPVQDVTPTPKRLEKLDKARSAFFVPEITEMLNKINEIIERFNTL